MHGGPPVSGARIPTSFGRRFVLALGGGLFGNVSVTLTGDWIQAGRLNRRGCFRTAKKVYHHLQYLYK